MRQIQVTVPEEFSKEVDEILEDYSNDINSSEAERDGDSVLEFTATVESEDIDQLTEELKETEMEHGELSIRVIEQESLIQKGQKTKGSTSLLSQEEIYSKAQEFSGFTNAQWALVGLSSAIAAYGLILNNLIVVIGAMMVAPMLSPFVSGAISLAVGDSRLMKESLRSGLVSFLLAIAVSYIASLPFHVEVNSALTTVSSFEVPVLLLSFLVGAAAAFTFAIGFRDQIAGVAVAVALVPPLAATGIGLKAGNLMLAFHSASIASINILSVLIAGFVSFKVIGLSPTTYYKKKKAEKLKYLLPLALVVLLAILVPLTLTALEEDQGYAKQDKFKLEAENFFGDKLIKVRFSEEEANVFVAGEVDEEAFKSSVEGFEKVEVIELSRPE